jgi:diaminohydroxyphosphoribosylaminopyrimidine deaminase / 5-amino-6-(5-phosphoribosylamino)uracil reductase
MTLDEIYMRRALDLARLGRGNTSPNPLVGCVIVHDDRIIGEGWHKEYGGPHAEVNAVLAVTDKSLLPKSKVYVTLEPCSHFGKTPPCANLLIAEGVKDVIICNTDPNPLVAGKGIQRLIDAGAKVKVGILEDEGLEINKRFFTFHRLKRPYIFLKWAETSDGLISAENYKQIQISGKLAQRFTHRLRSEEQAIMVGSRTAQHDNPQLNTRFWNGNNPLRLVIDKQLKLPSHLSLLDKSQPTVVYNYIKDEIHENLSFVKLFNESPMLPQIMQDLYKRNILSVVVEGGAVLLNSCLESDLWDEAIMFKSKHKTLSDGIRAPSMSFRKLNEIQTLGYDHLLHYRNNK